MSDRWMTLPVGTYAVAMAFALAACPAIVVETPDNGTTADTTADATSDGSGGGGDADGGPVGCLTNDDCDGVLTAPACQRVVCASQVCSVVNDDTADGTACTGDNPCFEGGTCSFGECLGGTAKDCSSFGNGACVLGVCDATTGQCGSEVAPDDTACDDGDPCTEDDGCSVGTCEGDAIPDCGTTGCIADPTLCDDSDACTIDECLADGTCQNSADPTSCVGTLGACVPADTIDPDNGNCICVSGADGTYALDCGGGTPCGTPDAPGCDDGLSCTTDICDTATGECSYTVVAGNCLFEGACYLEGEGPPNCTCTPVGGQHEMICGCVDSSECPDDGLWCTLASCQADGTCAYDQSPDGCIDPTNNTCVAIGQTADNGCTCDTFAGATLPSLDCGTTCNGCAVGAECYGLGQGDGTCVCGTATDGTFAWDCGGSPPALCVVSGGASELHTWHVSPEGEITQLDTLSSSLLNFTGGFGTGLHAMATCGNVGFLTANNGLGSFMLGSNGAIGSPQFIDAPTADALYCDKGNKLLFAAATFGGGSGSAQLSVYAGDMQPPQLSSIMFAPTTTGDAPADQLTLAPEFGQNGIKVQATSAFGNSSYTRFAYTPSGGLGVADGPYQHFSGNYPNAITTSPSGQYFGILDVDCVYVAPISEASQVPDETQLLSYCDGTINGIYDGVWNDKVFPPRFYFSTENQVGELTLEVATGQIIVSNLFTVNATSGTEIYKLVSLYQGSVIVAIPAWNKGALATFTVSPEGDLELVSTTPDTYELYGGDIFPCPDFN